jgi:hypothetical protein
MAILNKAVNVAAKAATGVKVAGAVTKEAAKAGGQVIKEASKATGKAYTEAVKETSREMVNNTAEGILDDAVRKVGQENLGKIATKELSQIDDISKLTKKQLSGYASDIGLKTNSKTTKKQMVKMLNEHMKNAGNISSSDAVEEIVNEGGKKIARGTKKNALIGSAIGGVSGAGIGGIAGMATGADEDNQNGMIVTGALAGIAGGAMVGGLFGNNITKVAGGIAKGASNEAVEGGAKGLLSNVGASAQNFADKIDDVGENVSNKLIKNKNNKLKDEIFEGLQKQGFDTRDALELTDGVFGDSKVLPKLEVYSKTANTIGGAAQGAIMGSAGGALVGGVAGSIDEDDTFIGGALKGGLIGGAVGGIGGGASGYFNNSAKILSNTTANVNSLLGK